MGFLGVPVMPGNMLNSLDDQLIVTMGFGWWPAIGAWRADSDGLWGLSAEEARVKDQATEALLARAAAATWEWMCLEPKDKVL